MKIANALLVILCLNSVAYADQPVLHQPLTVSEEELLDYLVDRCNQPTPTVTSFPLGFEHPMDLISCEVAEHYGKASAVNHLRFSEGSHKTAIADSLSIYRMNKAVGFVEDGSRSIDALVEAVARGNPTSINLILTHPERHLITAQQRKSLTQYYPDSLISLALDDLTKYDLAGIADLIAPIVKNLNNFSPEILAMVQPYILDSLLNKELRFSIYKELLALDQERQLILLAYLSTLNINSISNTEFPSIRRLLQIQLWSAQTLASGWPFDNYKRPTVEPLVTYLERLNYIDRFFKFDPSYISALLLIKDLKSARTQVPSLKEFDDFFPDAVRFIESIPPDFLAQTSGIIITSEVPTPPWQNSLNEAIAASAVLSGFRAIQGKNPFTKRQKVLYLEIFEKYLDRAPPFQRFFLEANYLVATQRNVPGGFKTTSKNVFDDFISSKQELLADGCPLANEIECFQYWTSFPRVPLLDGTIEDLPKFNCVFPEYLKTIGSEAANYYIFPHRFIRLCDVPELSTIGTSSNSPSSFKANFWKTLAYTLPIGGTDWGKSRVFLNGDLGVVGAHLLERSKKQNFPLNNDPVLMAYATDRTGWSYLLDAGNIPFPKNRKEQDAENRLVANFGNYADLHLALGNMDKAFSAFNHNATESAELLSTKPTSSLANLFFSGRSLGIPPNYLLQFMREKQDWAKPYENRPEDLILEAFYQSYLSDSESLPLLPTIRSLKGADDFEAFRTAARIKGQLWRGKSQVKAGLCSIDTVREFALDYGEIFPVLKSLGDELNVGGFVNYEDGNFNSICRAIEISGATTLINAQKGYDSFLSDSINPLIVQNQNVSDVRYLDSIVAFAIASMSANREFGAVVSLTVLKNIYTRLASAYVTRNSDTLRYAQPKLEKALVAIGSQVMQFVERNPHAPWHPLVSNWLTLTLSAKSPLLNDKVKARMIPSTNGYQSQRIKAHYQAINGLRVEMSESQSIFDYVNVVGKFSENSLDNMAYLPFMASDLFLDYNVGTTTQDVNLRFLSLSNAGQLISVLGINKGRRYFGDVILANKNVQPIIDQIRAEGQITPEMEIEVCNVFEPLHKVVKANINMNGDTIFVSPSVNLYPIPMELIIGSGCEKTNTPIILVNDFAGAVDAERKLKSKEFPQQLYAMANPSLDDSNGFDNLISDIRGHRLNQVRSIDTTVISNLPPLPDAELEVDNVSGLFTTSKILTGKNASISSTLVQAVGKSNSAILLATHGLPVSAEIDSETPALLSIENQKLGLVSSMDVYQYDLAGSTIMLSACDTAAGFVEDPTLMFTGFVKSFADAGADLIIASLWPVKSYASRVFSEEFFKEWKKSGQPFQALQSAKSQITGPDRYPFVMIAP